MTNLELLKMQYPLIEQNWDLITAVSQCPLVIIADRSAQQSINIKIPSQSLSELWTRSLRQDTIPQHILTLAEVSQYLVVDVTALYSSDGQSTRIYAYSQDFTDYNAVISQWQWNNLGGSIAGIGLYHDLPSDYKYYVVRNSGSDIVKQHYRYLVKPFPFTDEQNYSSELLAQEYENFIPNSLENVAMFDLNQALALDSVSVTEKEDKTGMYLTVWN